MEGADDCSAMKFSSSPPPEKLTLALNGVNVLVRPAPSLVSTGQVTTQVPAPRRSEPAPRRLVLHPAGADKGGGNVRAGLQRLAADRERRGLLGDGRLARAPLFGHVMDDVAVVVGELAVVRVPDAQRRVEV